MQIKEQRRQPGIKIMFSYPDSGPGECDLCGHVHQHGEAIASLSAVPGDNAFQICQECLEQYMDGDVDDILEALIEILRKTSIPARALKSLRPLSPGSTSGSS